MPLFSVYAKVSILKMIVLVNSKLKSRYISVSVYKVLTSHIFKCRYIIYHIVSSIYTIKMSQYHKKHFNKIMVLFFLISWLNFNSYNSLKLEWGTNSLHESFVQGLMNIIITIIQLLVYTTLISYKQCGVARVWRSVLTPGVQI